MATNTKRRRRKKKKNNALKAVLIVITIVAAALLIGLIYIIMNWRTIVKKAEELLPSSFSYPTDYEEYVLKYSKQYNVDPVFVFSVIKTESGFDPKATSEVGARGLMQLMDEAFNWLKFRMNDQRNITFDSMYDPETNIQYGTYFLGYLLEHYDNNMDLAAAAYHGGIGAVDSWIEQGLIDKTNVDVDKIPQTNDKTAEYVRRIRTAYSKYKDILNEKNITSNKV